MIWDKRKIEKSLQKLSEQIAITKDETLLAILKYDYKVLLFVLKSIDIKKYYILEKQGIAYDLNLTVFYEDFHRESTETLKSHEDILNSFAKTAVNKKFSYNKSFLEKGIPEKEYIEMVDKFLILFDEYLYYLFNTLKKDGNIHFARKQKEVGKVNGICYNTFSTKENYLITNYKPKRNLSTLPHEIAHAYELTMVKSMKQKLSWHFSIFLESYPRFVELAFCDFYKNSKHGNLFLEHIRYILENLQVISESYLTIVSKKENQTLKYNFQYMTDAQCIMSDFLAFYMFSLYKTNEKELKIFLENFHNQKGISDKAIFELLNFDVICSVFNEEVNNFNNEISTCRSRKKISF